MKCVHSWIFSASASPPTRSIRWTHGTQRAIAYCFLIEKPIPFSILTYTKYNEGASRPKILLSSLEKNRKEKDARAQDPTEEDTLVHAQEGEEGPVRARPEEMGC